MVFATAVQMAARYVHMTDITMHKHVFKVVSEAAALHTKSSPVLPASSLKSHNCKHLHLITVTASIHRIPSLCLCIYTNTLTGQTDTVGNTLTSTNYQQPDNSSHMMMQTFLAKIFPIQICMHVYFETSTRFRNFCTCCHVTKLDKTCILLYVNI